MPWNISLRDGKYCVVKQGESAPVPGGCHASRADAIKHQRALYANEPRMASMSTRESPVSVTIQAPPGTIVFDHISNSANPTFSSQSAYNGGLMEELTAAAAFSPPSAAFSRPEPSKPTPMTYEDDGSVYGHAALWGSCHRGFMGGAFEQCVSPPRSNTDYGQFHLGHIITAEGERLGIGKITVDTDHAPLTADVVAASRHYDNTGSVAAYVRATNGKHGIWLSGVLKPDLAPEALVALRANPLSGDWRQLNGNLEMVAALAVPVPGFPIPQLALSASAGGTVDALILPGYCECEDAMPEYTSAQIRQKKMLTDKTLTAAVLTTEARNALSRSDFAIPETRSYPIDTRARAANALARSSGKPEEARVRRAVCRRYRDLPSCQND